MEHRSDEVQEGMPPRGSAGAAAIFGGRSLFEMLRDFEASLISAALQGAGGNQRRAAVALGVLPTTLCEKMKRLGLRQTNARAATDPGPVA